MKNSSIHSFILLAILMLSGTLYAQISNYLSWEYTDPAGVTSYSGQTNSVSNFYRIWAVPENSAIHCVPGSTITNRIRLFNSGSINEPTGITLSAFSPVSGITCTIYYSQTPYTPTSGNGEFSNTLLNITGPLAVAQSYDYYIRITVDATVTNQSARIYITNTGGVYNYHYIISNTILMPQHGIQIVRASDSIHTITVFDGSQSLGTLDTEIIVYFNGSVSDPASLYLYYDVGAVPDGRTPDGTETINRAVRLTPTENGFLKAIIPSVDAEIKNNALVNILISADGILYDQSGAGTTTRPWRYRIREYNPNDCETCNEPFIVLNNVGNFEETPASIIFRLNRPSKVYLTVYTIRGEIVKKLLPKDTEPEIFEQGDHTLFWNGYNEDNQLAAEGLYLVHIETSGYSGTRKLILKRE